MNTALLRAGSVAGMLLSSTSAAVAELTGADTRLRAGLPLSRRVGVVALAGGSGTTSTVVSLASLLAHRRTGLVLAVDAAGGILGLHRQSAAQGSEEPSAAAAGRRRAAQTAADARAGLASTSSGLHLLDVTGPERTAATVAAWGVEVGPIARFFDLVVTDWGVRPASADLEEVAASSHLLVLVARADRQAANTAAAALMALAGAPGGPRTVLALVDVARTPDRVAGRLRRSLRQPLVQLPYETERSHRSIATSRRFSSRTRRANIRLAVTVIDEAIASQTPTVALRSAPDLPADLVAPP